MHEHCRPSLEPTHDPSPRAVGRKRDKHPVAGKHPDMMQLHLPAEMREHGNVIPYELHAEHQARQRFKDPSFFRAFHYLQIKTELMLIVTGTVLL